MWKPYCMWCVSMNVCVPFSLWWMCNEVTEATIQQFSIYELLTLERQDLNITLSWNNSTSLTPSPAPLSVLVHKASHAKQMVWPESQAEEEASSTVVLVKVHLKCLIVLCWIAWCLTHGLTFFKLYCKCEATIIIISKHNGNQKFNRTKKMSSQMIR